GGGDSRSREVSAPATVSNAITLTWNQVQGATGYKVYRGTSAGSEDHFFSVSGGTTLTLTDDGSASPSAGTAPAAPSATGQTVPVFLAGGMYNNIGELVTALQGAIDTAFDNYVGTGHHGDVQVCRPADDPSATDPCAGTGNRLVLTGKKGVVSGLAIDVPALLDQGSHAQKSNGAVTELGYAATTGTTQISKAGTFFLKNVRLSGTFDLVLQNVAVTANIGFLAVKASAIGTLPGNRLVSLGIHIGICDPTASTCDENTVIDLGTLGNAVRDGHFLYKSTDAGGDSQHPTTGFFQGTLSGGLGGKLLLAPDGVLAGLADTLNASLSVTATSSDWFAPLPTPKFDFTGPDFNAIIDRFKNLDFGTIIAALKAIV